MDLPHTIITARKKKGLTQEQLAELTHVTVRTIQRLEAGESKPRAFTLHAIAAVLDIPFDQMAVTPKDEPVTAPQPVPTPVVYNEEESRHILQAVCLSCFSYLVLPFIHFLLPKYILRQAKAASPEVVARARAIIRRQLLWKISLWLLMLGTLAWNIVMAVYFQKTLLVNYLLPFFIMYFLNAAMITYDYMRTRQSRLTINTAM